MSFPGSAIAAFVPSTSEARLDSSGFRALLAGFLVVVVVLVSMAIGDASPGALGLAMLVLALFCLIAVALLAEVLLRWQHLWRTRDSSLHYGVAEAGAEADADVGGGGRILLLRLTFPPRRVRRATAVLVRLQRHGGVAGDSDDGDALTDVDLEEWSAWATLPAGHLSAGPGGAVIVRDLAFALPVRGASARWRVIVEGTDDGEIEAYPIEPDAFGDGPTSALPTLRPVPLAAVQAREVEHADRGRIEAWPISFEALRTRPVALVPELRLSTSATAGDPRDGSPWSAEIRLARWRVGGILLLALSAGLAHLARTRWDKPDE